MGGLASNGVRDLSLKDCSLVCRSSSLYWSHKRESQSLALASSSSPSRARVSSPRLLISSEIEIASQFELISANAGSLEISFHSALYRTFRWNSCSSRSRKYNDIDTPGGKLAAMGKRPMVSAAEQSAGNGCATGFAGCETR